MYYLGVDTGGTFTDFVLFNCNTREIRAFKVRSQPSDPGAPVETGLRRIAEEFGIGADQIERFIFGTTVATNAVLERKGAKTALLTTRGMRDVLEIQRQWRQRLFDLYLEKPPPLAPRRWRLEVDERITSKGEVLHPLLEAEIDRCVEALRSLPIEGVAIVLLFSFLYPEHERRLAAAIRRSLPQLKVSISSEISPEFREYERSATTVMNSYTLPKINALVDRLEAILKAGKLAGSFGIIQSNGGLMRFDKARSHPVNTLLSGPAGGVVGATALARAAGLKNILTMDIGGTSTDIALVENAEVRLSLEGGIAGYPVRLPQVAVHTIGAGGGSIARPELGVLKVGPQSAGADPGPACYGQGGNEPTITDAVVCLGFIDPNYFLGGEMTLDKGAAEQAIEAKVARPFGMSIAEAALAIVRVQISTIIVGIRKVSVEAGHDPRDFALLPFGGAGGLYAGMIAEEMGIQRVFVPQHPSVLSALGMLMTDIRHTQSTTHVALLEHLDPELAGTLFQRLVDDVTREMAREKVPHDAITYEYSCDLRYLGQAYEINLRLGSGGPKLRIDLAGLRPAFHEEHKRLYGHVAEAEPVELVNLRVSATGAVPKAELTLQQSGDRDLPPPKRHRDLLFDLSAGWRSCPVYDRSTLRAGGIFVGPAVIEDRGSSITVLPGHTVSIDGYGNLMIEIGVR
jgi:N-methylhydantoinase A